MKATFQKKKKSAKSVYIVRCTNFTFLTQNLTHFECSAIRLSIIWLSLHQRTMIVYGDKHTSFTLHTMFKLKDEIGYIHIRWYHITLHYTMKNKSLHLLSTEIHHFVIYRHQPFTYHCLLCRTKSNIIKIQSIL